VTQSRRGTLATGRKPDNAIGFILDFVGPSLAKLPEDAVVDGNVAVDANAELLDKQVYRNPATGGWRVLLRLRRVDDKKPVEMRAYLTSGKEVLSETWSYILPPS
jgi:glucans biosynthesis protein